MKGIIRRVDAIVAGLLTIAALWLHWLSAISAGGLWRDEANTVGLATLPRITEVWGNLQFDSFPIVWIAIVRVMAAIAGPMNDPAFRLLGAIVGVSLIAALWLHARVFGHRTPAIALALVALSPSVIRWGDSMRAYGLGMTLIVVTSALVWRFLEQPSRRRFIAATALAVLSVQTLYYDSVLLLAVCCAAVVVCLLRKQFVTALAVTAIGTVAALSLIPYIAVLGRASGWNSLVRIPAYTLEWFWLRLFEAMTPAGGWVFFAWCILVVLTLLAGLAALLTPRTLTMTSEERETVCYAFVLLVVGSVSTFVFLKVLRYYTQPWYYLTLILVAGIAVDLMLGVLVDGRLRIALAFAALLIGVASVQPGTRFIAKRMTNADLIAAKLQTTSGPDDLILVNPWYEGVSFDRYFRGASPWMTVPQLPFHRFHRYDLIMALDQPETFSKADRAVLGAAEQTLKSGNSVYIVGLYPEARPEFPVSPVGPPPVPSSTGQSSQSRWPLDLGDLLRRHAVSVVPVSIPSAAPVNRYESMTLTAVRGWKE